MTRPGPVSLLWKILLSTSIAITFMFAVLGWIVQDQFSRTASANLEDEVKVSFQAYESLWRAQASQLASISLVLSRMPDVRAAFSTGDQATIRDTAGEIWDKISRPGALFLVTDPGGRVLASLGGKFDTGDLRDFPAVRAARDQFPNQAGGFLLHGGSMYQIVITPVYVSAGSGSALLNVLVAGIGVDTAMANELKKSTGGSDFVFVSNGRTIASTLMPGQDSNAEYRQFTTTLADVNGQPIGELRILRSFAAARRRISELRSNIVVVWIFTVLAGLGLTYVLARRIVKPVVELDRAAAELSKGNYDVRVQVQNRDEIGRLAQTFNTMCASIQGAQENLIRQERISTIGRLSTSIIHDLRNPLAAIYGGAEMLVDDDLSPQQVKRLASNIYRSSRRVQELLQELADVTRGRAHATETCGLREVIQAAAEALGPAAERQQVNMKIEVPENIELPLDRSPMERVFENLLSNALEAMPEGGAIRVAAERNNGVVLVSVEDTGPGIPQAIRARLFHPFVTAGKKNGIGLGLALSRQTVLDHGGDLWTDPAFRDGARFLMRLPV